MFVRIKCAALAAMTAIAVFGMGTINHADAARGDGGGGTSRSCLTGAAQGLLNRIESRFGAMRIVSTCRPGATIAGSGRVSRHASGNAIDFEAGGRKGEVVRWLVANHHSGGTMTYGDSSHIHVDVGPHFVSLAGGTRHANNDRGSSRSRPRQTASNDGGSRRSGRLPNDSSYMGLGASVRLDAR
jgi:Peptidase M15